MKYEKILKSIQEQGYRLTCARRQVIQVLCQHDEYLGAYDIHHILEENDLHVGVASVYRVLEMLKTIGLVQSEEFGSGGERFCLKNTDAKQHAHQLICTKCGRSEELDDCPLKQFSHSVESESGFLIQNHWLRLFGLCPHCRSKQEPEHPSSGKRSDSLL